MTWWARVAAWGTAFLLMAPVVASAQAGSAGWTLGAAGTYQQITGLFDLGPRVPLSSFVAFQSMHLPLLDGSGPGAEISARYRWANGLSIGLGVATQTHESTEDVSSYDLTRQGVFVEPRYTLPLAGSLRPFAGLRIGRHSFDADLQGGGGEWVVETSTLDLGWELGLEWWSTRRLGLELTGLYSVLLVDETTIEVLSDRQVRSGVTGNAYGIRAGVNVRL